MKAYAILAGGGVKGAALAGCLKAAGELGIDFAGYGGTSAGGLVALLAALGYSGDELFQVTVEEAALAGLLDDGGKQLHRLRRLGRQLERAASGHSWLALLYGLWSQRRLLRDLRSHLGLYRADRLMEFLLQRIQDRFSDWRHRRDITFEDISRRGCRPLKVVASDLGLHEPVVFSGAGGSERNGLVLDAVRASLSIPFVFQPVFMNGRPLVDGALSSNLPIFLFDRERRQDGLPLIAFDLVTTTGPPTGPDYGLQAFVRDLLETALHSGDELMQLVTPGLYHVRVPVPQEIDTLDFWLSRDQREMLWRAGYAQTLAFFHGMSPRPAGPG